jgi:hypothetical protein
MFPEQNFLDDYVALMKLVKTSCEFNAGKTCEAKFQVEGDEGHVAELYWRLSPEDTEKLMVGDTYSIHIRRL